MEGLNSSVQKLLQPQDSCVALMECSQVKEFVKSCKYACLIVTNEGQTGVFLFLHPGIGSSNKELLLDAVIDITIDTKLEINITGQKANSESSLCLYTGDQKYLLEFVLDKDSSNFIESLKNRQATSRTEKGFWAVRYSELLEKRGHNANDSWPWSHIINPQVEDSLVIALDADADLSFFDPLSSTNSERSTARRSVERSNTVDLLEGFDNIEGEMPDNYEDHVKRRKNSQFGQNTKESPLRRSGDVLTNVDSQRYSSAERSFSLHKQSTHELNDGGDTSYDVVDPADVKSFNVIAGNRSSTIFRGERARENFLKLHMAARENEFTEKFPFRVFIGTWNVNGQPPTEDVSPWLDQEQEPPDIIACGFQELDLSPEALVFNDSSRVDAWLSVISKGLPKDTEYKRIRTVRLVGIMLTVFVQTKHMEHVCDVEAETVGTGIMGMMGNKGGVAVRFQLHNSSLCFVNSHLAAHMQEYQRRNQDYKEISTRLQFSRFQPALNIRHHDIVIWLGDLNYRLDDLDADQVKALIDRGDYDQLIKSDQLHQQMKLGKVFEGYTEHKIHFRPTYKYDPGTDNWDTSDKCRAPAWCDRILWKGKNISQLKYCSHPVLKLSDHKPVSGLFEVGIKIVNKDRQKHVFEEIVWKLDRQENESLPQVKLGKNEFDFPNVQFMEERTELLPVANIGQVPAEFTFIPKLDEENISQPWMQIQPLSAVIMPGEVLEVELTIFVDKMCAATLTRKPRFEDILVLHLADGKDFFVPINGNYIPSVFGSALESLVLMYGPIRPLPVANLLGLEGNESVCDTDETQLEPLEIPKELWLLVDHLYRHGMKEENILIQPGVDEDLVKIRNHLDTCQKGSIPGGIFSVGEALLLFLEALPIPVIPFDLHYKCMEGCNNYVLCKQIIHQLPRSHANVFCYIMAFLRELLKYSPDNKLDAKILGAVMGSIILRPSDADAKALGMNKKALSQAAHKKGRFIYHFLVNDFRLG